MNLARHLPLLAAVAQLLAGCGTQGSDIGFLGRPIINGDPDTSSEHRAVVGIEMRNSQNLARCTGTLIAPRVVLTAAHCLEDWPTVRVFIGDNINGSGSWIQVEETLPHPGFTMSQTNIVNDIGLIRLQTAPLSVTPIPHLPANRAVTTGDIGTPLEFVGYGETETGSSGIKMTVTNDLSWVCTSQWGCNWPNPGHTNTICTDMNPGGTCHGDSGGPAFILRSGQEYVAGVTSYGDQYCDYYGCSTKVDAFETFINDFVGGYLGADCAGSAECNSGFCVDGVCCESVCDDACKACNQAGSRGTCLTVPNGTSCPDTNLCNGEEVCLQGECVPGEPLDCANANLCTDPACDPATGCLHNPLADGTACPNATVCDGAETCLEGICRRGEALNCDDRNLCTQDTCDASQGCQHASLPDGTSCGGGACGEANCSAGECVASAPTDCDDQDPCTRDWCDPESGCLHDPLPQGYECGSCLMCVDGDCIDVPDCVVEGCGCGVVGRPAPRGGVGRSGSAASLASILLVLLALFVVRRR